MKKAQVFIVFTAFILVVFGFQNCSAPMAPQTDTNNSSSTAASKVAFAFDTDLDQIAYMSCHELGTDFDRSSYFTFRAGAYSSAGAGLSSQFLSDVSAIPQQNWKYLVNNSPMNTGAQPTLSVRQLNNLQGRYASTALPGPGNEYASMLMPLTSQPIVDTILKNSSKIRYQRNGLTAYGTRVEGDLNFNSGIQGLNDAQKEFMINTGILAVTYPLRTPDLTSVRAPVQSGPDPLAFGKGYQIRFRSNPSATYGGDTTQVLNWVLGGVDEINLNLPATDAKRLATNKLTCPNNLIFKIVDPRDLATSVANTDTTKIYCDTKADDPASLTPADQNLLRRARLSLRAEDWFIDWSRKCIVPKKYPSQQNQCYGPTPSESTLPRTQRVLVEYDLSKTCVDSPTTNAVHACAAFASICYR